MKVISDSLIGKKITAQVWKMYKAIAPDKLGKSRPSLDCVYANGTKMVVTNGHFLITDKKSEGTTIESVAIKPVGKLDKLNGENGEAFEVLGDSPLVGNGMYLRTLATTKAGNVEQLSDMEYPDYEAILPKSEPTLTIGLSADYLKRISDYVNDNATGVAAIVQLEIRSNMEVVVVTGSKEGATAYLMPAKLK